MDKSHNRIEKTLICIDPGSAKSGLAVLNFDKTVIKRKIIQSHDLENELSSCIDQFKPDIILMGDGTWSKRLKSKAGKAAGKIPFRLISEKHSTERARLRYFRENPPKGLWKLVPVTMRVPKEPIDDYAAIIMAEDYIDNIPE